LGGKHSAEVTAAAGEENFHSKPSVDDTNER
jgi:hypothetical protein